MEVICDVWWQEIKGHCTKIVQEEEKIKDLKSLQKLSTSISVGGENGCKNTPKRDARHMVGVSVERNCCDGNDDDS